MELLGSPTHTARISGDARGLTDDPARPHANSRLGHACGALRDLSVFSLGEQSVLAVRTVQVVSEDASRGLLQPLPRGVCKHRKPRFVYGHAASVGGEAVGTTLSFWRGGTLPLPADTPRSCFPYAKESLTPSMESHGLPKAMPPPSGRSRCKRPFVFDKEHSSPLQVLPKTGGTPLALSKESRGSPPSGAQPMPSPPLL